MAVKVEINKQGDDGWITNRVPVKKDGLIEIRDEGTDEADYMGLVLREGKDGIICTIHDDQEPHWDGVGSWKSSGWRPCKSGTRVVIEQG